jgi:uncharacterized membrane protein YfhO
MLAWVLENPLMYFPERICLDGDSVGPGCIFSTSVHLDNIGNECTLDSVIVDYNRYGALVANPTEHGRWLILNSNYHHLWTAEMNDKSLPIVRVNHLAMGVFIPSQTSGEIQFVFDSPALPWAVALAFVGVIALVIVLWRSRKRTSV